MTEETRQAFLDLYFELVLASHQSLGEILDQIRLDIETHGYTRGNQSDLNSILKLLKRDNDPTLAKTLQGIIDSLGPPQRA